MERLVLDDLKLIHARDSRDMLGTAGKQWQFLSRGFISDLGSLSSEGSDVLFCGEAGPAACWELARSWTDPGVPCETYSFGELPAYVSSRTVAIVVDYMGGQPWTREALHVLQKRGVSLVVVTASEELAELAKGRGAVAVLLPPGLCEQQAMFPLVLALHGLLRHIGRASAHDDADRSAVGLALRSASELWAPTVPASRNPVKQLALELAGKSLVLTGGPLTGPSAMVWKMYLNRNAKHVAWASRYPFMVRDELSGWTKQPVSKPYAVICLSSSLEAESEERRAQLMNRLLSGMRPEPHVVEAVGATTIEQSLYLLMFGEYVSLYLALASGLDPAASEVITKYDRELA